MGRSSEQLLRRQSSRASHASCLTSTLARCRPCVRGFAEQAAISKGKKTSRSHRAPSSRMQANWDACNTVSRGSQRRGRLTREFEPSQPRRLAIKIFFETYYLKSAAEHFRMEQSLQRALGLAIGGSED